MKFILGLKLGMSQMFNEKGDVVPITLIEAGPCIVLQIKTKEKDGYESVQVGFKKFVREFKNGEHKVGEKIDVAVFEEGKLVKIAGVSKGKGFQGAVKRWGFSGRNATHGVKHEQRSLGSVGISGLERVLKGRKMAGRMGFERTTLKNLKIIKIDKENNLLAVKGAVPGIKGTLLEIRG